MEGQEMAYAKLRECSSGQPSYHVEVYYDGQGECYFRGGWSKFFFDYGAHEGWFILLTRHDRKKEFTACFFDATLSASSSLLLLRAILTRTRLGILSILRVVF
jgi:hypothetical protein